MSNQSASSVATLLVEYFNKAPANRTFAAGSVPIIVATVSTDSAGEVAIVSVNDAIQVPPSSETIEQISTITYLWAGPTGSGDFTATVDMLIELNTKHVELPNYAIQNINGLYTLGSDPLQTGQITVIVTYTGVKGGRGWHPDLRLELLSQGILQKHLPVPTGTITAYVVHPPGESFEVRIRNIGTNGQYLEPGTLTVATVTGTEFPTIVSTFTYFNESYLYIGKYSYESILDTSL